MEGAIIRRSFDIYVSQDRRIEEWAATIPDMNKSMVMRVVLELGLREFADSPLTEKLRDGTIKIIVDQLTASEAESKKRPSAKRRSQK